MLAKRIAFPNDSLCFRNCSKVRISNQILCAFECEKRAVFVFASISIYLSLSLCALDRRQTDRSALHVHLSVATLQASEGESPVLVVTCSTQHFRGRPGCFLQVSNCSEPCRDVTERCRAWWAGAAWSIRLTWPKRCLLRLTASFMDGSCERVATSTFVTNSYHWMPSLRLWFVKWKASSSPVSLDVASLVSFC